PRRPGAAAGAGRGRAPAARLRARRRPGRARLRPGRAGRPAVPPALGHDRTGAPGRRRRRGRGLGRAPGRGLPRGRPRTLLTMPGDGPPGRSALAARSIEALAADGRLAGRIPAFVARPSQQRLAAAVADALQARDTLLAEAGTGPGTPVATRVRRRRSGPRAPAPPGPRARRARPSPRARRGVRAARGTGRATARPRGRANSLCRSRLERAKGEPRF